MARSRAWAKLGETGEFTGGSAAFSGGSLAFGGTVRRFSGRSLGQPRPLPGFLGGPSRFLGRAPSFFGGSRTRAGAPSEFLGGFQDFAKATAQNPKAVEPLEKTSDSVRDRFS